MWSLWVLSQVAVVVLPSPRERIPQLLEEDRTVAEHAAVHGLVQTCEQAVAVWGCEELVLRRAVSHHISVVAARALVLPTARQ